jgi:RND family efflux transporter MFP subunit
LESTLRSIGICTAATLSMGAYAAEFDCLIEARRTVAISGPVEALIAQVRVDRGDAVKKGDVLVEFDSGVEKASSELARVRAEMLGAVQSRQARADFAVLKHERRVALTKENFISLQEADEAAAERRLAEADLVEAKDNRRLAGLEHRRAVEVLRQRTLTSPVTGVVVERTMHPGEVFEVGKKSILRVAETSDLHVEVILPMSVFRQVAKGDVGLVRPEAPIGGSHEARVTVVDRVFDASSGTFGVRLELPNPNGAIPAGVRCKVEFAKVVKVARPEPSRSGGASAARAVP